MKDAPRTLGARRNYPVSYVYVCCDECGKTVRVRGLAVALPAGWRIVGYGEASVISCKDCMSREVREVEQWLPL